MPVAVLVAIGVGVVLVIHAASGRSERRVVTNYVQAWAAGDYAHMYSLLDAASQAQMSEGRFAAAYRHDASTATVLKLVDEHVGRRRGQFIPVQMLVFTRLFGELRETLEVAVNDSGSSPTVQYMSSLLFPGLQAHERLSRHMTLPPRATLFAADGTPLAEGPDRTSPISDVASQIVGTLGPIPAADAATYAAEGYPANAKVGTDGLERVFQTQLAGTPGGVLLAGKRTLARTTPVPGHDVTTTIEPSLEQRRDRGARQQLRRDRRDGPAHRRAARARRDRVLRAPAARVDDEDHHLDGRARGRDREADRRLSVQHRGDTRRLHACTTPAAKTAGARC